MNQQLPDIDLRYFNVRGRAQFIRYLLSYRKIAFTDTRIALSADRSSWLEARKDRTLTGSFQKLPALQWGDTVINETLVIMNFLHQQLGDADQLDVAQNLRHSMLMSSAFLDLLSPCINLIWADIFNPGVDMGKASAMVKNRMQLHLQTVNQTLQEWQWLSALQGRQLMAADALLWEALDIIKVTFAGKLSLHELDALNSFYQQCPGADTFRTFQTEQPAPVTARPGEPQALEIIHSYL